MQSGQQFGPFTLDEKLGAGAMGVVWRAVYTKTQQVVAIKIMMPGLSEENENAVERFEREIEILKQLDHPNIVKLFGVGKYKGARYYAMEYIKGESLDRVMSRRGRMSWEEVAALGKQLCSALQHAHDAGVIHRDLKPSNLMVIDGKTIKLTDFGIAKDLDRSWLTSDHCTVGTASYMSPEQCKGERHLTAKSDLYSLGVVFYELLTGEKPYKAENAMEMFVQHVKGKFVRPGKLVLDLPVWFDNLVCQMLEKKPDHRPMDASMVGNVLGTIEEKVQTLQSAGGSVATRKRGERARRQVELSEQDRELLRAMTGKGKKKAPRPEFYERGWFVGICAVLLLAVMATVVFLGVWFWPRSSSVDKLYASAKPLMESKNPDDDWSKAIDPDNNGPLYQFERYHADEKGEKADQMRQWAAMAHQRECDKLVRRSVDNKKEKKLIKFQAQDEIQENAFDAGWAEEEGDLKRAAERWTKVKELAGKGGWFGLASDRLQQLTALDAEEKHLQKHLSDLRDPDYKPKLEEPEQELAHALRYQRFGDNFRAYREFEKLREKYSATADQRSWYLFAAGKARELKPEPGTSDDSTARKDRIKKRLDEAIQLSKQGKLLDARSLLQDIIALYGGDTDYEDLVKQAKDASADIKIQ